MSEINTGKSEAGAFVSADGLRLYFQSDRPGGFGGDDLWMAKRTDPLDAWGEPENLGPLINGPDQDFGCFVSADGLSLFFCSDRRGGFGLYDIWMSTRDSDEHGWGKPSNLGGIVNGPHGDIFPVISPDGLQLYFSDYTSTTPRPGGIGKADIWVSYRSRTTDPWGPPVNAGSAINSQDVDVAPKLSPDGLMMFFSSRRSGGVGNRDIWFATREDLSGEWEPAMHLGKAANGYQSEVCASVSGDMKYLILSSDRLGGAGDMDIWVVPILSPLF